MCTIVLFRRVHPDYPLLVAANRDEFYARRTVGPEVLLDSPRVVGGRDLERGGTWMGVTRGGFFVGVSNQRTFAPPDPTRRSRGELVLSLLGRGETRAARELVLSIDARDYNPHNLVFGDAETLHVAYAREGATRLTVEDVPDGVHVLPNDRLDSPDFPKVARVLELARPLARRPWPELVVELPRLLADRVMPALDAIPAPPATAPAWLTRDVLQSLQAICVETPMYGTRSSTVLAIGPGRVEHYLFADGAPTEATFRDVTPTVRG